MSSSESGYVRRSHDHHHWYWVAAIPVTFLLWLVALAWLAVASQFESSFGFGGSTVQLSLVALGIPFAFLTAYFPLAVYRDTSYIDRTSGQWAPNPMRQALLAAPGLVVAILVAFIVVISGNSQFSLPVIAGFLVSVPFATYYIYRRRARVGVPDVPW